MTISINYKLIGICGASGSHYDIDITPGPTVKVHLERVRAFKDYVDGLTVAERVELSLALHANANNLTLGQVRDEVAAVNGLDLVL